jgi:ankyrin repeat protein
MLAGVGCSSFSESQRFVGAAIEGRKSQVEAHIANGVDVDLIHPSDNTRKTPLLWVCTLAHKHPGGDHKGVVAVLLESGADVEAVDAFGNNAAVIAAAYGSVGLIELLLQHGVDINHRGSAGNTPLMAAARAGHLETVKFLLAGGADSSLRDSKGENASEIARGHDEIVRLLTTAAEAG